MEIYGLFIALLIILTTLSIRPSHQGHIYILGCVLIVIFAAFRSNGFDWLSYEGIYNLIRTGHKTEGGTFVEYGFEFLCRISPTYKFLIFGVATISLILTFKGVYYFSKSFYPVLGLLIFSTTLLLPTYMGQIRQGLAIGFISIAVWQNYIHHKKNALIAVVCACCFHFSAILGLLIFFIPKRNFKLRTYFFLIIGSLIFYGVSLSLMSRILAYNQLGVIQKLLFYASTEKYELGLSSTVLIRITTLILAAYLNNNRSDIISYISKIYLCGIMVYLLFGYLPQLGLRGSLYFTVFEMVLVPYILFYFRKEKMIFIIAFCAIVGLSIFRMISFFSDSHNFSSYVPYLLF